MKQERVVREFKVVRRVRGEYIEHELRASFEIIPSGHAILIGDIFPVDSNIPWDGHLNAREKDRVEHDAYEEETGFFTLRDTCILDPDFDDSMAMKIEGLGRIEW
jgi:hypothetical protein